jgi:hypothetical protein
MPDARPLTPGALEFLLADAGHETFVSFVADLLAREGRDVRREGPVIVAEGPDRHRDRALVWTDERNAIGRLLGSGRSRSDPGPVDAVVTRDRDRTSAAAIAESHGAEVIDTDELHDRLLYAIDREACLDLCREHVGVAVDPVPARPGREGSGLAAALEPRVLVTAVALLGIVVVAAAGLPTAPGESEFDPGSEIASPDAAGAGAVTPIGAGTPRPEDTPTATPTPIERGSVRCEGCSPLLSIPDLSVAAGSRTTVTTTLENPYSGTATGIDVRLVHPSSAVRIEPSRGKALGSLEPNESRPVMWNLSAIDSADGTYDVVVVMRFREGNRTTYARDVVPVTVTRPTATAPDDCGGSCAVLAADRTVRVPANGTTAVPATVRNPYADTITDVEVTAEPHGDGWAVTPADGTRLGALPPGDSRALRWNLTAPESAAGEYSLVVGATFTGPDGLSNQTVSIDYSVYVGPPGAESGWQRAPSGAKGSIGENN